MAQETHTTEDAKLYELGFHINPSGGEEKALEVFSVIKEIISKNKGSVVKFSEPKAFKLAYTIIKKVLGKNERFKESFFAWIKFNALPEDISKIKLEVEETGSVIRYVFVKTVDDDEHSTSKLVTEYDEADGDFDEESEIVEEKTISSEESAVVEAEEGKDLEKDNEEIDKAIDELVEEK